MNTVNEASIAALKSICPECRSAPGVSCTAGCTHPRMVHNMPTETDAYHAELRALGWGTNPDLTIAPPEVWEHYANTKVHLTADLIEVSRRLKRQKARYGKTIHVISAQNPYSQAVSNNTNVARDRDLAVLIAMTYRGEGSGRWRVMAGDDGYYEASWAVTHLSRDQACLLGRTFNQHAIFEYTIHQTQPQGSRRLIRCWDETTIDQRTITL